MSKADGFVFIDTKLEKDEFNKDLRGVENVLKTAMIACVAAVGALSVAVIKVGSDYEVAAAKVSTLVDENTHSMEKISENILNISSKTGIASTEIAEATYQALSAGISGTEDEMTSFVEKSAKLAKAGFTSTASAVDIVTTAINGYGLTVNDADSITNQLIMTQNLGKTTVNELSATLGRVIPTASAFGVSLGNVNTAMAIMTASGINTAESSTYLKSMLNELGNTGSDVSKILTEKTGKSFSDLMKEGKTLGDIMDILGTSVDNDATAFANLWSSQEAGTGALSILNAGTEKYNTTLEKITGTTDAVDKAYGKVTDTFQEKSKVVQESLKNVGIAAYNKFEEPLKGAMESAQGAVDSLAKEMSSGKLGKSVDKVADGFADLIKITINLARQAIPLVVNGFAFIADNGKLVATTLTTIGSAMLAYKTYTNVIVPMEKAWDLATKALLAHEAANRLTLVASAGTAGGMTILQTTVGVLTGKITLATAAQGAWNAITAMHPAAMLTIAVGALAAGIAALAICMGDTTNAHKENMDAIQSEIDSYNELKKKQEEQLSANLGEIENIQNLNDELENLVDANGRVKEGYEARAGFIVGELNSALGLNMQLVDGEIQGYKDLSTSIDNLIAKKRAEIILESQLPAYKEAITKATEEQIEANKINASIIKNNTKILSLEAELVKKYGENWRTNYEALASEQSQALHDLKNDTANKQKEYDLQNETIKGYYSDISSYETNATLLASGNAEEIAKIETNIVANKGKTASEKKAILADTLLAEEDYLKWLKDEYERTNDEILLGQIEASENKIRNTSEELKSMTSTVTLEQETNKNVWLEFARKGVEGVMTQSQSFKNSGHSTARGYIDEVVANGGDALIAGINLAGGAVAGTNSVSANSSGRNFSQGFINGATAPDVMNSLFSTGMQMAGQALAGLRTKGQEKSPWKTTIKSGEFAAEGLAIGIENETDGAVAAMENLASGVIDKANINPIDELLANMDVSTINDLANEIDSMVASQQSKFTAIAKVQGEYELNKYIQLKDDTSKMLKAVLDGEIHVHVDLDGREVGIGLAPIIAEELAFK